MIDFTGAKAVPIPLREENGFGLDVDELESLVNERTRLLIINSPANPTGGVLDRAQLERIASIAVEHDLIVMADEIYAELIYDGEHTSIATFPGMAERTVILDGFSKTYAMTGWRLGYGTVPDGTGTGDHATCGQQRVMHLGRGAARRAGGTDRTAGSGERSSARRSGAAAN